MQLCIALGCSGIGRGIFSERLVTKEWGRPDIANLNCRTPFSKFNVAIEVLSNEPQPPRIHLISPIDIRNE